jgi:hypothetical protein
VGALTEDDQILLVTKDTQNRGGPHVTMYEVEGLTTRLEELGKGNRTCQPNWQSWHKESSLPRGQVIAELLDSLERTSGPG